MKALEIRKAGERVARLYIGGSIAQAVDEIFGTVGCANAAAVAAAGVIALGRDDICGGDVGRKLADHFATAIINRAVARSAA